MILLSDRLDELLEHRPVLTRTAFAPTRGGALVALYALGLLAIYPSNRGQRYRDYRAQLAARLEP